MKKTLLVILFINSFLANAAHIQINFVNGFNIHIINPYPSSPSEGTATTDSAINTIFSNHSVFHCVDDFGNPSSIIFADYNGSNVNSFITDLLSNSNVTTAKICYDDGIYSYAYANLLYIKLISNAIGNPIGTNGNGNITTTNAALNSIFDNYAVKAIGQAYPSSLYYMIQFDGDITLLRGELNGLNTVIETTELVGVAMLLSSPEFNSSLAKIYPNPFSTTLTIDSKENISNFSIYDITGKQLIYVFSKEELENASSQLHSGIYFLKLQFENGKTGNYKLVKK